MQFQLDDDVTTKSELLNNILSRAKMSIIALAFLCIVTNYIVSNFSLIVGCFSVFFLMSGCYFIELKFINNWYMKTVFSKVAYVFLMLITFVFFEFSLMSDDGFSKTLLLFGWLLCVVAYYGGQEKFFRAG